MPAPPPAPHLLPIKDTPSLLSHPTPPLTILLSKSSFSVLAWEGYALLISFLKLQLTKVDSPHTSPTSLLPPHALRFGSHGQNRHQAKVQQLSMVDELRSTNAQCSLCLSRRILAVYPLCSLFKSIAAACPMPCASSKAENQLSSYTRKVKSHEPLIHSTNFFYSFSLSNNQRQLVATNHVSFSLLVIN